MRQFFTWPLYQCLQFIRFSYLLSEVNTVKWYFTPRYMYTNSLSCDLKCLCSHIMNLYLYNIVLKTQQTNSLTLYTNCQLK